MLCGLYYEQNVPKGLFKKMCLKTLNIANFCGQKLEQTETRIKKIERYRCRLHAYLLVSVFSE